MPDYCSILSGNHFIGSYYGPCVLHNGAHNALRFYYSIQYWCENEGGNICGICAGTHFEKKSGSTWQDTVYFECIEETGEIGSYQCQYHESQCDGYMNEMLRMFENCNVSVGEQYQMTVGYREAPCGGGFDTLCHYFFDTMTRLGSGNVYVTVPEDL